MQNSRSLQLLHMIDDVYSKVDKQWCPSSVHHMRSRQGMLLNTDSMQTKTGWCVSADKQTWSNDFSQHRKSICGNYQGNRFQMGIFACYGCVCECFVMAVKEGGRGRGEEGGKIRQAVNRSKVIRGVTGVKSRHIDEQQDQGKPQDGSR